MKRSPDVLGLSPEQALKECTEHGFDRVDVSFIPPRGANGELSAKAARVIRQRSQGQSGVAILCAYFRLCPIQGIEEKPEEEGREDGA